jgi:chromosome segregation ATPase
MAEPSGSLTLEGLAQILRQHMDWTAARFAEVGAHIGDLRAEIGRLAVLFVELAQVQLRQTEALEEHRGEIRQILSRMERQDARIEQQNTRIEQQNTRIEELHRDIQRILDTMQRPGGDGGGRPQE